ncbi:cell division protein FtsZ [Geofilum sp. OHC36d9]|uniref:cell division protein FtsZ n=1 Tax=Geofilum sp. OHC36d9 TaxID=3458413 RepID=UPI0040333C35
MTDDLMSFEIPSTRSSIIKVIGVGGGGSNAVNYMYGLGIKDVNFVVCNTDAQALANSPVPVKVQLGSSLTEGRGAGNKPEKGRQSAIESIQDVTRVLEDNTKMVFITAGMGGGTGTGAAPVIAKAAKDMGILTVGIVTIPFRFEGLVRINQAIDGISEMEKYVDSLLIINNERLRDMYGDLKLSNAFSKADNVLATAAKGIAEIITVHGYINVDFADVETVMKDSGVSVMGSGTGSGEFRAIDAIQAALESPLLNSNNISGARNILLNITSGVDEIRMDEVGKITDYVQDVVGHSASIIWGTGTNEALTDEVVVTIIATGFAYSNVMEAAASEPENTVTRFEMDVEGNVHPSEEDFDIELEFEEENADLSDLPPRVVTFNDVSKEKERKIDLLYGSKDKQSDFDADGGLSSPGADVFANEIEIGHDQPQVDVDELNDEKRIEEMENVPAYKRRKLKGGAKDEDAPLASKISRFTISDNGSGKPKITGNNRFLHDNVD